MTSCVADRNVFVPMRDGVELCTDIFRPPGDGPFPALLGMSPYGKDIQTLPMAPQPMEFARWARSSVYNRSIEAGDPEYLTRHGYAHVIPDLRGIGRSGDTYRGWLSELEVRDGYDLVEWIAAQPWCDGNVGMVGVSYFGSIQPLVAALQPPHLKAIMPWNSPSDFYRECTHHGGIAHGFFHMLYAYSVRGRKTSVVAEELAPDELERRIEERASDRDLAMYAELWNVARNPDREPGFFDILMHPTDGPFYWDRSPATVYDKISIPAYCASHWWGYAHMHLRGAFDNFVGIGGTSKLRIDGMEEAPAPFPDEYNAEVVRWYDRWLKGVDTGIVDEPPITLFVMGANRFRAEREWPLARTEWTPLYLRRWHGLSPEPEPTPGAPDCFVQQPPVETSNINSIEYFSAALDRPLELTGPISLTLYASIDSTDTNWIVSLADLAPDGTPFELTKGFLKASHRAVDEARSQPWRPYHPHLAAEPVEPDEIVEYRIELSPTSNVFKPGHRIKLSIACLDHRLAPSNPLMLPGHLPWHICRAETVLHRVFHDAQHPSHLLLPVIPESDAAAWL